MPAPGNPVQREALAVKAITPQHKVKTASEWTNDPWMDAAHRGIMPPVPRGDVPVQAKDDVHIAAGEIAQSIQQQSQETGGEVEDGPMNTGGGSMAAQLAAMPDAESSPDGTREFAAATAGSAQEIPYRSDMEAAFHTNFSDIQAYTGVGGALGAMDAEAAASGNQVAFAASSPSREVVAHELAHVVQGRPSTTSDAETVRHPVSRPGDAAEVEADQVAAAVVASAPIPRIVQQPSAQISRSFISFALKMSAKKASKGRLKNFIKTQIKSRLNKLTNKKLAKELAQEADDVLGMLDDPWWVTGIGLIPILGDAFDLVNVPMSIRAAVRRADQLEDKVNRALQAQRTFKRGQQIIAQAARLGYSKRIPANRAPFPSHGQAVFSNGKNYITRDVDQHLGGVWKMFDRGGRRLGTYDANLNRIGK